MDYLSKVYTATTTKMASSVSKSDDFTFKKKIPLDQRKMMST